MDLRREQMIALHEAEPANLGLLTQLAEMAFETGKLSEAEQWEKEIHNLEESNGLEGSNGVFWRYYRAQRCWPRHAAATTRNSLRRRSCKPS